MRFKEKIMKKPLLLLILLFFTIYFIFINSNISKEPLSISFYHWENSFNGKNTNDKLYVKILDISYSSQIEVIKTTFEKKIDSDFVPVVYITNDTMKNINYQKISDIIVNTLKQYNYSELQIDCDWSLQSKSNYFKLLDDLKIKLNKTLSATIRLHQIKYYQKTGIPPVDYGLLMYYNMSTITDINTKNSILDNEIARKYHYNFDNYKLKLKLALPLYSQAIQFRDEKALDIFEGVLVSDFNKNFKKISQNKYEVLTSTYFQGRYIYKGDVFRFEDSNIEDLQIALDDFLDLSKNRFNEIVFYTLKYKNKYNLDKLIKGK